MIEVIAGSKFLSNKMLIIEKLDLFMNSDFFRSLQFLSFSYMLNKNVGLQRRLLWMTVVILGLRIVFKLTLDLSLSATTSLANIVRIK